MSAPKKKPSSLGSFDTLRQLAQVAAMAPAANTLPAQVAEIPAAAANASGAIPGQVPSSTVGRANLSHINGYSTYDPDIVYELGDHVLIPLDLLEEHPRNPRVFLIDKDTQELVASIAANGQMECGLAYPKAANGRFRLKGGHRRLAVLRILNEDFMKIEIVQHSANELEEYRQARALNQDHHSHTHIDDALRFAELLKDGLAPDQTALAAALKVSESVMSRSLSIAEMPRLILEPMAENIDRFGFSSSYYIYRYWTKTSQDETKTLALIQKVIDGRLSVRALEALVAEATGSKGKPGVKREHAVARSVFSGLGEGELKSYAAGKLTLELSNLDPGSRDLIYARIVEMFNELGVTADAGGPPAKPDSPD